MLIFTSIRPEKAGLSGSLSTGVRMLDAFLRYAAGQARQETADHESPETAEAAADLGSLRLSMAGNWLRRNDRGVSGIALEIKEALQKQGLKAVCGIGRSSFRVDLGITDPAQPERYKLGILLDAEHLESDRTFSDLEIGRKKVLEGLGWKLVSVRAIDWYDSPEKVLSQITEMLL